MLAAGRGERVGALGVPTWVESFAPVTVTSNRAGNAVSDRIGGGVSEAVLRLAGVGLQAVGGVGDERIACGSRR